MEPELRSSAAHVFVAPVELERTDGPALEPADVRHLGRVLRLRVGEAVSVSDGAGRWRLCRWKSGDQLAIDGEIMSVAQPDPAITIGFTPVKGDRPEWTVQKLTELGVDRIIPLRTARSVVRWEGSRAATQVDRLRRVAREASMQARRCHLPCIDEATVPGELPGAVLAQFGGSPLSLSTLPVLVGPEGGWDATELEQAQTVSLGPSVLRAETAAVALGVLLGALRTRTVVEPERGPWS